MNKFGLIFLFSIAQFSLFGQEKSFVVDSIMDVYMRNGYANEHFMGKGKYNKVDQKTGKWKDYEVKFENFFLLSKDQPEIKIGYYLIYGEGKYVSDKREGEWELFVLEDKTFEKIHFKTANYVNGKFEGSATYYYPNGNIAGEANYQNDKIEGDFIQYFNDGQIRAKSPFSDGKLEGKQLIYYPSGKLYFDQNYTNDSLNGDYTRFYENGNVQWSSSYKMGLEHGTNKYFYENGQLWTEKIYSEDLLMNVRSYSDTGEELDHGTLIDGTGTVKYYQENGELYFIRTLENGHVISEEEFGEFDW